MLVFVFFKQKTAYEMRISDWSSDVCSSDLLICAFKQAFRPDEPVRLVLKSSYGDRHPAQMQELRDAAADANITIIDQVLSPDEEIGRASCRERVCQYV